MTATGARDVPTLLRALQAQDPGRPRVTWYGPDDERVELSARVLDNWVAKTGNLLVEELDATASTTVRLDLPMHWRTVVWALAVPAVGAHLVGPGDPDADAPDVLVTTVPPTGSATQPGRVVAVELAALARSVANLPPEALDYNAEVSGFGDVLAPADDPAPLPPLPVLADGVRLLVTDATWDVTGTLLAPLAAGGSVVLVGADVAADPAALARVREAEQVSG
ncbi:TIGR03089 family protein [Quadrisphaera sp. GCM10027208]|uniref:TIGR03089 family protein n=1 Tax=Quadrisphaera sp. GCM10027208 TaxID=3273423 RepID=UPI00361AFBDD